MPRGILQIGPVVLLSLTILSASPSGARAGSEGGGIVKSELRDGIIGVEGNGASVPDVVADLSRTLGFDIDGEVPNKDLKITRKLEGRLEELLAQLLRDANYLLVMQTGAPKRLIVLQAGPAVVQPFGAMSVEELRRKEGELVAQIAQYEDMSQEARERAHPELARKFEEHISELTSEMQAVRTRQRP